MYSNDKKTSRSTHFLNEPNVLLREQLKSNKYGELVGLYKKKIIRGTVKVLNQLSFNNTNTNFLFFFPPPADSAEAKAVPQTQQGKQRQQPRAGVKEEDFPLLSLSFALHLLSSPRQRAESRLGDRVEPGVQSAASRRRSWRLLSERSGDILKMMDGDGW